MKTNKLIILINELEESQQGRMPGLERPDISVQDLLSLNNSDSLLMRAEDVFIGSGATWEGVKERIEEYLQLSYLREGKLEIVYFSIYDVLTRLYTNDADNYFHFYNNCVRREEIESLVHCFPSNFPCEFVNRSNGVIKRELIANAKRKGSELIRSFHKFLTITSSNQFISCA